MQHLVSYSIDSGFHGTVAPVRDHEALYDIVYDRTYLSGWLEDKNGDLRTMDDITAEELVEIYQQVTMHEYVVLVDSYEAVINLSDNELYQSRLIKPFIEHNQGRV